MNNTKNLLCIGLEDEFKNLKKEIDNLEFHDCKDFLEMAEIIKASKFYVGNMSFQYIIAEGLKIPRLLECSDQYSTMHPNGNNNYEFSPVSYLEDNHRLNDNAAMCSSYCHQ